MTDNQKRAGYASNKAHPPKASQQIKVLGAPRMPASAMATTRHETVDEFIARGGSVQTLAPHECSAAGSMRFDHSDTRTPTALRRATRRPRPYAPHA